MEKEIRNFMKSTLASGISTDYLDYIIDELISDVIEDVKTSADADYSDDDIRLAVGRVLFLKLGMEN